MRWAADENRPNVSELKGPPRAGPGWGRHLGICAQPFPGGLAVAALGGMPPFHAGYDVGNETPHAERPQRLSPSPD